MEFYPSYNLKNGFTGSAHVYLPEIGVDLRGVRVNYNKKLSKYEIGQAYQNIPDSRDPNINVKITFFCIRDIVERKLFALRLHKVVSEGIMKKYGMAEGHPDVSKMVFTKDAAREGEWVKKNFEYFKKELTIRNISFDSRPYQRKPFQKKPQPDNLANWKFKPTNGPRDPLQYNQGGYRGRLESRDNRRSY